MFLFRCTSLSSMPYLPPLTFKHPPVHSLPASILFFQTVEMEMVCGEKELPGRLVHYYVSYVVQICPYFRFFIPSIQTSTHLLPFLLPSFFQTREMEMVCGEKDLVTLLCVSFVVQVYPQCLIFSQLHSSSTHILPSFFHPFPNHMNGNSVLKKRIPKSVPFFVCLFFRCSSLYLLNFLSSFHSSSTHPLPSF